MEQTLSNTMILVLGMVVVFVGSAAGCHCNVCVLLLGRLARPDRDTGRRRFGNWGQAGRLMAGMGAGCIGTLRQACCSCCQA